MTESTRRPGEARSKRVGMWLCELKVEELVKKIGCQWIEKYLILAVLYNKLGVQNRLYSTSPTEYW